MQMLAINDNGFIPEDLPEEDFFESRDKARYPLKRIMALAAAAARRIPRKLGLLRSALADSNPLSATGPRPVC